jgi:ribosomal protein S1
LPHDIEGLIHVSEMRIYGDSNPEDVLQPGDIVIVRIVSIDPVEERIGLSQRRVTMAEEMNWMQRRSRPPEGAMDAAATEEE